MLVCPICPSSRFVWGDGGGGDSTRSCPPHGTQPRSCGSVILEQWCMGRLGQGRGGCMTSGASTRQLERRETRAEERMAVHRL
jgi:hypothetical protein